MDDLISRDDAIRELNGACSNWEDDAKVQEIIMAIPSAEYSQGWIPITESEPNTSDHVLVTYKWDGDDYEVSELDYWVTEYEAEKGNEECKWLIDHVTAWMPLPKPYREDGE